MAVRGIKWPGLANLVVSLVAIHKGQWNGLRLLDGKKVAAISSFFEDSEDIGESKPLSENADMIFEGVKFLGEGFLLTHEEAKTFIDVNPQNKEVIFKLINGDDLNGQPD